VTIRQDDKSVSLSVVATLYRSAPHLREFYERTRKVLSTLDAGDHELVLVNDGSPDDSLAVAAGLVEEDPRCVVVDLSRNFGHHKAMMAGLGHARGDLVFLIDCDLEEEPELLPDFLKAMRDRGVDMVYGVQESRRGGVVEKASGAVYYAVLRLLSDVPLPQNVLTVRLMSRRYVDALLLHGEREVNIAGLWQITGFEQASLPVTKTRRAKTNYGLVRKLSILVQSVTAFSNRPLVGIFLLGMAITLVSLGYIGFLLLRKFVWGIGVEGWTSIVASIWLLGGIILFAIGMLGIYLAKVFVEVKERPNVIVRQVLRRDEEEAP